MSYPNFTREKIEEYIDAHPELAWVSEEKVIARMREEKKEFEDWSNTIKGRLQKIQKALQKNKPSVSLEGVEIPVNLDRYKFTRLVYVDVEIPLDNLISMIRIGGYKLNNCFNIDLSKIGDVVQVPKQSYCIWMNCSNPAYKGANIPEFPSGERGATLREGIFSCLYYNQTYPFSGHQCLFGSLDRNYQPIVLGNLEAPYEGAMSGITLCSYNNLLPDAYRSFWSVAC